MGCSLLVAGYNAKDKKSDLYQIDPSGAFWAWKASGIGKDAGNTKSFLEKRFQADMELDDAIHTAILTIKEGYDGVLTEHGVDVAIVGGGSKEGDPQIPFHLLTHEEIKLYMLENE
ncbi:MAG: putative 20S proteasome alpha subunit B [Streblomastix strix]|uniref:Putative 20S proteasome alpha subunit B n=1 Tax=Streblomastix strix TaxID=222440 RepID=A0A5J4SQC5_9EUKA|nr:MAG: putative 20S proteasome alpha subunit B [Streblomastix strix]